MIDFIAGAISGVAQTIVGHPLDTLKVNIQTKTDITGLKPLQYFRGISFPLYWSVAISSISFGIHKHVYKSTENHLISGSLSGIVVSPLVHLLCVGKIKRQVGMNPRWRDFIYTRGFFTTVMCECIGFGTYFYVYHTMRNNDYNVLTSGAIGGLANWTASYPFDVIRSRQNAYNITFRDALRQGKLYGGYVPCAIRAVLVNGAGFWVYEKCLEMMKNTGFSEELGGVK